MYRSQNRVSSGLLREEIFWVLLRHSRFELWTSLPLLWLSKPGSSPWTKQPVAKIATKRTTHDEKNDQEAVVMEYSWCSRGVELLIWCDVVYHEAGIQATRKNRQTQPSVDHGGYVVEIRSRRKEGVGRAPKPKTNQRFLNLDPTHAIVPALELINDTLAWPVPTVHKWISASLARTPPASNGEIPYPLLSLINIYIKWLSLVNQNSNKRLTGKKKGTIK